MSFETEQLDHARHCGNYLMNLCHDASRSAGWWTHEATGIDLREVMRNPADELQKLLSGLLVSQKLCLTHSEVSEAMEGDRKGLMDDKLPHRKMAEVELADALIRIFDYAAAFGYDLQGAYEDKMAFNAQREDHKHEARQIAGGKKW